MSDQGSRALSGIGEFVAPASGAVPKPDAEFRFPICGALAFRPASSTWPATGLILFGGVGSSSQDPVGNKLDDFTTLFKKIGDAKDTAIWRSPLDLAGSINECEIRIVPDFRAAVKN